MFYCCAACLRGFVVRFFCAIFCAIFGVYIAAFSLQMTVSWHFFNAIFCICRYFTAVGPFFAGLPCESWRTPARSGPCGRELAGIIERSYYLYQRRALPPGAFCMTNTAQIHTPCVSEFLPLRRLRYHVRHWGNPDAPKIFMLHGWMDVAASFQFVVDSLQGDWHVIAPDWRGFGLTVSPAVDNYWFPDYLGDLEALLDHYAPQQAVNLLGHSMGGNIASLYAGIRPARVRKLINLEGFGLPVTEPSQAPARFASWLDALHPAPTLRSYASAEEVALRLQKTNPRLSNARAAFLARHWAAPGADGRWAILGDPAHKMPSPLLFQVEEMMACWRATTAPVLWVEAEQTNMWQWMGAKEQARAEIDRRVRYYARVRCEMLADAGHMMHHDQPQALARLLEEFLGDAG
jgi:pimeloyl-ACP methyl ester carboxylesterase